MKTFDSQELERLIKGHCRGELDSVRIHDFVRQVKTNTLNHILDSGLLKNKPMTVFRFVLKGEELEQYMRHRGHNQAVEAVKELISKMNSV